jgi:sugar diacid utilization regulator
VTSVSDPEEGEGPCPGRGPSQREPVYEDLLRAAPGPDRGRRARRLGVEAAEDAVELRDLVTGLLGAAASYWSSSPTPPGDSATAVRARAADLLRLLEELLAATVDGYDDRMRAELSGDVAERSSFVEDLLSGRADPGRLARRAQRYGLRLAATHIVTVARGPEMTSEIMRRLDGALAARFGEGNTLTARRGADLVCISAGGLRGLPAEMAYRLLSESGTSAWRIAVGRAHRGLRGVVSSLDEALGALDLAERLGFTAPVLQAADLLVFPVLLRDREAITDLVTSVLGPLARARGGAGPYLETLSVLFESQGNCSATARRLHLSVRAVTYRLDRIRALTGYHPGEPTQRFTLQTAVLGARLLDWPDGATGGTRS